ncbi:amidase [Nocardioides sp. Root151]|uniref:amidase n=1 Tax=Nocardioides sp. Root151 TaxID=1736475 RepID=UPI0007039B72|nr:amidase [Nocardioides sp. Root151]KQZ66309.1 hypothetical protein ASD66_22480 [Nocardioides sp. Root151]
MNLPATLVAARAALDSGELTSAALLEAVLERSAVHEPAIRSLVTATVDLAREHAAKADARLAAGESGPLLGIPVVLKDLIDVAGLVTTAGSRVLEKNVAHTNATVWSRLEQAGAVLVGKANTHEFAYGGTTEPTRNPANPERIVGGSSGGPAAALAAGLCLGAVGTDTAGSIRIPANLCGVAGLKPTRGLVPTDGIVPLSPTLDVAGPMARSVADLDPLLRVLAGLAGGPTPQRVPRTVGVLAGLGRSAASVDVAVSSAADAFGDLGARVMEVRLPGIEASVGDNFTIIGHEASRFHARWANRADLYTPYVRARLAAAALVTDGQYDAARASGMAFSDELDQLLDTVEVLLLPGVPFPASPAYDEQVQVAGEWEDRDTALCRNTAFANLAGHPVLAIPAGLDEGLPVGVQLVGRRGSDLDLIAIGASLEPLLPDGLPPHLRSL